MVEGFPGSKLQTALAEAQRRGLLGPAPLASHVANAEGFAEAVGYAPAEAIDIGTGGGLPGLALAMIWPHARLTLVDSHRRAAAFLREVVVGLGLDGRVAVICERVEILGREDGYRARFPLVVARSFGSPAVTAEAAAPLLVPGQGLLVVSEPPEGTDSRWQSGGLAGLGLAVGPLVDVPGKGHFQVLQQIGACPDRYPRRPGVAAKRPLF